MHGPASRSFISQRLRLHYADWGNPDAPPLVLVHGGRDHCRAWDDVASRLAADWHVMAPDLRGHGDSQWADAGGYLMTGFIYDLVQLITQQATAPVTLVAHSLGGAIATRAAGLYPELVRRLVNIEGLGPSPKMEAELAAKPLDARLRGWVDEQRQLAARPPRRYATLDDALARMRAENAHLSAAQALHLTRHGVRQNEDGTFSWKFDPYIRSWPPVDLTRDEIRELWGRVACPTLLVYGTESWASNPAQDGRAAHFRHAQVALIEGAGHWVHHDRLDAFMAVVRPFLA
jgi:pimeloyl-ACP methyl ester carboxylesterase